MSHVATIDIQVTDLDALDKACTRLGLELVRGQTAYRWWGSSEGDYPLPEGFTAEDLGKCDHAITIPGNRRCFEIGVVRRRDGKAGWNLLWDFFGHRGRMMSDLVGKQGEKLKQAYATVAATRQATKLGYRVREQQLADGRVKLICTR